MTVISDPVEMPLTAAPLIRDDTRRRVRIAQTSLTLILINDLADDLAGRLYGCCPGGQAIVYFDSDGKNTIIADHMDGKKLNTPYDDPPHGADRVRYPIGVTIEQLPPLTGESSGG
jgi:hypothetical protein